VPANACSWLDDHAAQHRGEPIVIAMHHPPFQTLIGHMDRIGLLEGAEALAEIVAAHPNVERVICGHLHRTIYVALRGTVASTAPARRTRSAWTWRPTPLRPGRWSRQASTCTPGAGRGSW
jgi:Icc protein